MKQLVWMFSIPLLAHDLYVMPQKFHAQPGESLVISVHVGDSFPSSEEPVDPRRVVRARLTDGTPMDDMRILGRAIHAVVQPSKTGSIFAIVETSPSPIEMPAAKFEAYLKEEGLNTVSSWRQGHGESSKSGRELYAKFAKALIVVGEPTTAALEPVGLPIEFVPLADPSTLAPGASLPARVIFQGEPAAGLQVEASWSSGSESKSKIIGRTGDDGCINIPIERAGKYRLHAVAMQRSTSSTQADWESFWASLTFEVK